MKPTMFVDFDDVLTSTEYKKNYWKIFQRFGISSARAQELYKETKRIAGYNDYRVHARLAGKPGLAEALWNFRLGCARYLTPRVHTLLAGLRKTYRLELLTMHGNLSSQRKMVQASGLAKYFSRMHFVHTDVEKTSVIRKRIRTNEKFYFVDDKLSNRAAVTEAFPHARTFSSLARATHSHIKIGR